MNALRMYIRESLVTEAVGRKTFGVFGAKFGSPLSYTVSNSESDFSNKVLDFAKKSLGGVLSFSGFRSGGKIGLLARASKALVGAGSSLWKSPGARLGAVAFGLGTLLYGKLDDSNPQSQTNQKSIDADIENFIQLISKEQNDRKDKIVSGLRDPAIVNATGAMTAEDMRQSFKLHYAAIVSDFCEIGKYDNFKQKFSSLGYQDLLSRIDAIIKDRADKATNVDSRSKPDVIAGYQQIALNFLICTFINEEILLGAMRQDIDSIGQNTADDKKFFIQGELEQDVESLWKTATQDDGYKNAAEDFSQILSAG